MAKRRRRINLGTVLVWAVIITIFICVCGCARQTTPLTIAPSPSTLDVRPYRKPPSGPIWIKVTGERGADLSVWSDADNRQARDWTQCWETLGDTSWILCPDGWVEGS